MKTSAKWIVSTINGKIVSVSLDYVIFADIVKKISWMSPDSVSEISCTKKSTEEVLEMSETVQWEDMRLFGTPFQKTVWKHLFDLTHSEDRPNPPRLLSYTEFAELCGKRAGVRAVAHAIGQNPVAIIIPCHLIVPKETMDRIEDTERQAEHSLFGKAGLRLDPTLDFGEYRYGKEIKKRLILDTA